MLHSLIKAVSADRSLILTRRAVQQINLSDLLESRATDGDEHVKERDGIYLDWSNSALHYLVWFLPCHRIIRGIQNTLLHQNSPPYDSFRGAASYTHGTLSCFVSFVDCAMIHVYPLVA